MIDSLFNVIASQDSNDQGKLRQVAALASQRVEDKFGSFLRHSSAEDAQARYDLVKDDIRAVVAACVEQVGAGDVNHLVASIVSVDGGAYEYRSGQFEGQRGLAARSASVHEARKPKMCPYHSEVTDISLASGDPQSGFNAMAQHAWGSRHCQGDEWEGKCNFKPAMTTQTFWDDRAEKREERKLEREQQAEQMQPEVTQLEIEEEHEGDPSLDADMALDVEPTTDAADTLHDGFEGAPHEELEAVAASTRTAEKDNLGGNGTPSPKMDKSKWTRGKLPELTDVDDTNGPNPSREKDIVEPIEAQNESELKEIGEGVTEHQDVTKNVQNIKGDTGTFPKGNPAQAVSKVYTASEIDALVEQYNAR